MQLNHSGSCNKNNEFRVTDQVNEWKFSAATYIPQERGVHFLPTGQNRFVVPFCGAARVKIATNGMPKRPITVYFVYQKIQFTNVAAGRRVDTLALRHP